MNELETTIRQQQKRLQRYENIDGTAEMGLGGALLGYVLLQFVQPLLPPDSFWTGPTLKPLFAFGWLPMLGLCWWGVKTIRNRITYRRTGYAAPRREKSAVAFAVLFLLGVGALLGATVFFLLRLGVLHNAVGITRLALLSFGVSAYAFYARTTTPEHRWKLWLVFLLALFSVAVSFAGLALHPLMLTELGFFGAVWLTSGLITLYLYVRRTQPIAKEDE